ncbi:MAG: 50S ribosomal protein L15 [Candidatus Eisenbacteria bacterium]|uniref:Large ribosomal subunit protein uL15 n=1 Tax=Eiseniibacteriota bacterium TaxID=2212470 RepID=A0A948RX33_UNCEI|nr:50S ribosomal protein L15 [Candidatus Eisenbacteria bacterium]MBU1950605.1 50S ribosomal protein L15 [Candidatus Eisenbacteria bacterium]MBU2691138.1 50S ribosomal protein L15 [Candidatus Eisenbacteria bacterium]
MKLDRLEPAHGSRRNRKRRGCGSGSNLGVRCGRGDKGQKARAGGGTRPGFEGGQMPLQRRVPKRGFTPLTRRRFQIVDLARLGGWDTAQELNAIILAEQGFVRAAFLPVKLLGTGEAPKGLKVKVDAVTKQARKKIEDAGGSIELIGGASS